MGIYPANIIKRERKAFGETLTNSVEPLGQWRG
jgi:hypothetical protein